MNKDLPIVSIAPLRGRSGDARQTAGKIAKACRRHGFFYVVDHGVDDALQHRLELLSRRFFEQDLSEKLTIRMALAGRAWRGYFPVGEELTSGRPDRKEGVYFGAELDDSDPRVRSGIPLHGRNLFPQSLPKMREIVLRYMDALTALGKTIMSGIALSLGLSPDYFGRSMADPFILFRIFHYPVAEDPGKDEWGVGEHTDYGVLTILKQDKTGGLEVKSAGRWIEVPPVEGSFVCNIGDMLEKMTRGIYVSTPHRVRNVSGQSRFSYPFFFDPNFDSRVEPIDLPESLHRPGRGGDRRWDGRDIHVFDGTYGDYILEKVARVFPDLTASNRDESDG